MAVKIKTPTGAPKIDEVLTVKMMPVASLKAYEKNPRKNDAAVPDMVELIQKFGFKQPILVRGDRIVDGHLRIKAAKKMGLTEVPAIDTGEMSDAEEKALRIAMNRSVEWADWDNALLAEEFKDIADAGVELKFTGFETSLIDKIMDEAFGTDTANAVKKSANADAGNPADPNYVSVTFHMADTGRKAVLAYLDQHAEKHGLANRSQALIHLCK